MARSVYSTNFFSGHGINGSSTYNVPAGFIAVVRDADVFWGGGVALPDFRMIGQAGQTIWFFEFVLGHGESIEWRGRQVIDPLGTLTVVTGDAMDVTISGYLLSVP